MIYQDYMRRKMHNVVKLDTAEGYPLTVYSCANTNLKDYTIYGNTGGVGDKFEPYNKYKIQILVNGNEAAVIYRDAQLVQGESINYKSDNLPDITLEKGTNTITANTEVKPSSIKIKYLKK